MVVVLLNSERACSRLRFGPSLKFSGAFHLFTETNSTYCDTSLMKMCGPLGPPSYSGRNPAALFVTWKRKTCNAIYCFRAVHSRRLGCMDGWIRLNPFHRVAARAIYAQLLQNCCKLGELVRGKDIVVKWWCALYDTLWHSMNFVAFSSFCV